MSDPTDEPPRGPHEAAGEIVGTESAPALGPTSTIPEPVEAIELAAELAPSPNQFPAPEPTPNQSTYLTPTPSPDALLPASADLQDAVGAPKRRRREPEPPPDDDLPTPKNRRAQVIAGLALFGGLAITALIFLGRANSDRYLIVCTTDRMTPEQGRSFPPWGSHPLAGPAWKPIALPPNAECTERETDSLPELEHIYLDKLVDRASTTLTSKTLLDKQGSAAPLDAVGDQLTQALLLARSPDRRDQRKEIERLQGDVTYWRATLRLRDAQAALLDAAKQFDAAAALRPRHVTDADAWATFLRRLTDELHAGPNGTPAPEAVAPAPIETPRAPLGSALPVEPAPSSEPPPPVDAGVPTGGVLL